MHERFRLPLIVVVLALVAAACTSTTVVEQATRAASTAAPVGSGGEDFTPEPTATPPVAEPTTESGGTPEADGAAPGAGAEDQDPTDEQDGGFGLGGAEQIEGLVTDCEAGSNLACDILFQISDFDSTAETVALNCGGRSDVETLFCTPGIEAETDSGWFDEASPGLSQVATDCEEGDMTACDFLYFRSPPGSSYEDLGNTCGDRVPVALPDCRTALPE